MNKEKQKLHERLLDASDALLVSCDGNQVSVDILGDFIEVGDGLSHALAQNEHLTDFMLSVLSGAASISVQTGEMKLSGSIKKSLEGALLFLRESEGKIQN